MGASPQLIANPSPSGLMLTHVGASGVTGAGSVGGSTTGAGGSGAVGSGCPVVG